MPNRAPVPLPGSHQRAVDQPGVQVEDVAGVARSPSASVGADLLGRVQGPPAAEHRQPPEQHPLGVGEHLVAPVDRRPQRPLPRVRGPRPAGEQPEPVVEPGGDLADGQQP